MEIVYWANGYIWRLKLKLYQNDMKESDFRIFMRFLHDKKVNLCWKHFEPLFVAFGGVNAESSHFIVIGVVNHCPVDRIGETTDRPVGWLCNWFSQAIQAFCNPVDQSLAFTLFAKSKSVCSINRLTKKIDFDFKDHSVDHFNQSVDQLVRWIILFLSISFSNIWHFRSF